MARRPKPTKIKEMQGTLQKCRTNKDEPKLDICIPQAPADLDEKAMIAFQDLGVVLHSMQVLTIADRYGLVLLVEAWSRWREAVSVIKKKGLTYETHNEGNTVVRPRPEVAIADKSFNQCRSMLIEFGLTPASRSKINVIHDKVKITIEDLID